MAVVLFCILLSIRFVDFGYRIGDSLLNLAAVFFLLLAAPLVTQLLSPLPAFLVHFGALSAILLMTCEHPEMGNGGLYGFGYLFLTGGMVTGPLLWKRCLLTLLGYLLCGSILLTESTGTSTRICPSVRWRPALTCAGPSAGGSSGWLWACAACFWPWGPRWDWTASCGRASPVPHCSPPIPRPPESGCSTGWAERRQALSSSRWSMPSHRLFCAACSAHWRACAWVFAVITGTKLLSTASEHSFWRGTLRCDRRGGRCGCSTICWVWCSGPCSTGSSGRCGAALCRAQSGRHFFFRKKITGSEEKDGLKRFVHHSSYAMI